jgi:hypothetical protein
MSAFNQGRNERWRNDSLAASRRAESVDQFWAKAATPAFVELMCLICVILYLQSGSPVAIGIAVVGVLLFVALNPGSLETLTMRDCCDQETPARSLEGGVSAESA